MYTWFGKNNIYMYLYILCLVKLVWLKEYINICNIYMLNWFGKKNI